ncbi:MAG TPA: hypothetical protein VGE79_07690, partial [Niastella sp.]
LYNKNIQQEKQYELNKLAEQKKRVEDSVNLAFQRNVAASFVHSVKELKTINATAKENIKITTEVSTAAKQNLHMTNKINEASAKNFELSQGINKQTAGILTNTEKVLNPLFPLYFVATFRMDASSLDHFWKYMSKFRQKEEDQFSNQLNFYQYSSYKEDSPEMFKEFQDLFKISLRVMFSKQVLNNADDMSLTYDAPESTVDFSKFNIYLDFANKSLLVILVSKFQKPTVVSTNNWKGETDLQNSTFEVSIAGNADIQLSSVFIDHGASSGVYLYGKCFFDLEQEKVIPWVYHYQGKINLQESGNQEWCVFQHWLQRLFNEKD